MSVPFGYYHFGPGPDLRNLPPKFPRAEYIYDPEPVSDPELVRQIVDLLEIRDEDSDRIKLSKARAILELHSKLEFI